MLLKAAGKLSHISHQNTNLKMLAQKLDRGHLSHFTGTPHIKVDSISFVLNYQPIIPSVLYVNASKTILTIGTKNE